MKYSNILIVSDIDGTFTDSQGRLVQKNIDAVERFKAEGGLFAIATGRLPDVMGKLSGIVETLTNAPCICCNGAFAYDFSENRRFNEIFLNSQKATEFVRLVERDFPEIAIRLYKQRGELFGKYVVHVSSILETEGPTARICDIDDLEPENWYRVSFDGTPELIAALRAKHEPDFKQYFDFVTASPEIYEFNDITATKGTALDRLRALLIEQGRADESLRICAVGDFQNDLDMLRHSDLPCCPDNAIAEVKAIAKWHLCKCDDGAIAELIDRL